MKPEPEASAMLVDGPKEKKPPKGEVVSISETIPTEEGEHFAAISGIESTLP